MYFCLKRTLDKFEYPIDQPTIDISRNQILFNRTFLKNPQTKPLCHIPIFLFFQDFDNSLYNNITPVVSYVFNALYGGDNNRNERSDGVFERIAFY